MQQLHSAGNRIVTLSEVWMDYQRLRPLKPKTLKVYRNCLALCFSDWMSMNMLDINKAMVEERHRQLSEHPAQANLAMRLLRALFTFAGYKYELDLKNPVKRLSELKLWNRVRRRDRYLTAKSFPIWMRAVLECSSPTIRDLHLLLILTGLRKNEAIQLRWTDINFTEGLIHIPDTKNGDPHILPMSKQVQELLVRRLNHRKRDRMYVFRGRWPGKHLSEHDHGYKLISELSGVEFTYHDLRRTFATIADDLGFPLSLIKRLLNHRSNDVTLGYFCNSVERLREPMQAIADEVLRRAELASLWR